MQDSTTPTVGGNQADNLSEFVELDGVMAGKILHQLQNGGIPQFSGMSIHRVTDLQPSDPDTNKEPSEAHQ